MTALLSIQNQHKLAQLEQQLRKQSPYLLGYPLNTCFDYSPLLPYLQYSLNNAGDPYQSPRINQLHTHAFEQDVLAFFAQLLHAPADNYWGYISNGGTEGNLYGLYIARERYPQAKVYYSAASHYSIAKNLHLLAMPAQLIASTDNGEIDYLQLAYQLKKHKQIPAIIIANIGTTMTGAIDDIIKIRHCLSQSAIHDYFIHADAALHGMLLPFIDNAPRFDFSVGIDSISISGHKFIGSPLPCGITLTKKTHSALITKTIDYIGTLDATISGSRNGITPLFLWYAIQSLPINGFKPIVAHCLKTAHYAVQQLKRAGIAAWKNDYSIIVVLQRVKIPASVLIKWQIAVQDTLAHLVTMPHVSEQHIDAFIDDILNSS